MTRVQIKISAKKSEVIMGYSHVNTKMGCTVFLDNKEYRYISKQVNTTFEALRIIARDRMIISMQGSLYLAKVNFNSIKNFSESDFYIQNVKRYIYDAKKNRDFLNADSLYNREFNRLFKGKIKSLKKVSS